MAQSSVGSPENISRELALALLMLEHQLKAYQRLHAEDIASLQQSLDELKKRLLNLETQINPSDRLFVQTQMDEANYSHKEEAV